MESGKNTCIERIKSSLKDEKIRKPLKNELLLEFQVCGEILRMEFYVHMTKCMGKNGKDKQYMVVE